jgi:hypothetical protein
MKLHIITTLVFGFLLSNHAFSNPTCQDSSQGVQVDGRRKSCVKIYGDECYNNIKIGSGLRTDQLIHNILKSCPDACKGTVYKIKKRPHTFETLFAPYCTITGSMGKKCVSHCPIATSNKKDPCAADGGCNLDCRKDPDCGNGVIRDVP